MKKINLVLVLLVFILIGCNPTVTPIIEDVVTLSLDKVPSYYVELNDEISGDDFTVNLTINEDQKNLSIIDEMFTTTGLVGGKLDTTTIGEKEITVKYKDKTVTIKYFVVDYIVGNYEELAEAVSSEGTYIVLSNNI